MTSPPPPPPTFVFVSASNLFGLIPVFFRSYSGLIAVSFRSLFRSYSVLISFSFRSYSGLILVSFRSLFWSLFWSYSGPITVLFQSYCGLIPACNIMENRWISLKKLHNWHPVWHWLGIAWKTCVESGLQRLSKVSLFGLRFWALIPTLTIVCVLPLSRRSAHVVVRGTNLEGNICYIFLHRLNRQAHTYIYIYIYIYTHTCVYTYSIRILFF